jgi:hypothetical protein
MSEVTEQVEEQVEEQAQEEEAVDTPANKYQELLNQANAYRQGGVINNGELTILSLLIQGMFALGMDLSADIRAAANYGLQDGQDGGEGETPQMDLPFEGNSGDESAV